MTLCELVRNLGESAPELVSTSKEARFTCASYPKCPGMSESAATVQPGVEYKTHLNYDRKPYPIVRKTSLPIRKNLLVPVLRASDVPVHHREWVAHGHGCHRGDAGDGAGDVFPLHDVYCKPHCRVRDDDGDGVLVVPHDAHARNTASDPHAADRNTLPEASQ